MFDFEHKSGIEVANLKKGRRKDAFAGHVALLEGRPSRLKDLLIRLSTLQTDITRRIACDRIAKFNLILNGNNLMF